MSPTVLVALDGSPRAPGVFRTAATYARALGARVVLFTAILVPPDYSPADAKGEVDPVLRALARKARESLRVLSETSPDLSCELRVERASQPWRAVIAAADAARAELIVLGSHGYHGWDHILGTTAGKVANRAERNVLVVHQGTNDARG
jgi:nucleotide-binding universal stress UspA family protein